MDPRNPKRPDGDAGSNWTKCLHCGRGAAKMREIVHAKGCPAGQQRQATLLRRSGAAP